MSKNIESRSPDQAATHDKLTVYSWQFTQLLIFARVVHGADVKVVLAILPHLAGATKGEFVTNREMLFQVAGNIKRS